MLATLVVAAMGLAWVGSFARSSAREDQAVERLLAAGFEVNGHTLGEARKASLWASTLRRFREGIWPVEKFVRLSKTESSLEVWQELRHLRHVVGVSWDYPQYGEVEPTWFTSQHLAPMADWRDLRGLTLEAAGLTQADLRIFRKCSRLGGLALRKAWINDVGCEFIAAHFPKLIKLSLRDCPVTDSGARILSRLTELEKLDLRGSDITHVGLRYFAQHPKLREVQVPPIDEVADMLALEYLWVDTFQDVDPVNPIGDRIVLRNLPSLTRCTILVWCRMLVLKDLPSLRRLSNADYESLEIDNLTGLEECVGYFEGTLSIRNCPEIQRLELWYHTSEPDYLLFHSEELWQQISALKKLQDLKLYDVEPEGVQHLAEHPSLQTLHLVSFPEQESISDAQCEALGTLSMLEELELGFQVSDQGLRHVCQLSRIRKLKVRGGRLTTEGLQSLRLLPRDVEFLVYGVQLPEAAVEQLSKARPDLLITHGPRSLKGRPIGDAVSPP